MRTQIPLFARFLSVLLLGAILDGCSMSKSPISPSASPADQPSLSDLQLRPSWAQGRVRFFLTGPSDGLEVFWLLPAEIKGTLLASIDPAAPYPQVYLYHGTDVRDYLAPRGAPRPPRDHESASAGRLECGPTSDPKVVRLTLTDLHFKSVDIPKLGPFDITLDGPPAP